MVQLSNFLEHPYTLKKIKHMASFSKLTPEQTKHIQPVNPTSVTHLLNNSHDDAFHYINCLLKTSKTNKVNETYWFPTPQNPGNEKEHTPFQTRILNELRELEQLQNLNPLEETDSRDQFLSNFDWADSTLQTDAKQAFENLLVIFHDIFARHRFDIGIKTEFKVQLTPLDNRPAKGQSLPAPINLKDDILVELALLHKYGIITTLPFSKYASPIFAQRKPNGKLRLSIHLRKKNTLIADDYFNNIHPVSTLTDAAQHAGGKTCSANLIVPKRITAFKCSISNPSNSLHYTSQVEHLHTEDWHKDSAVPYRHFRVSYESTSTRSSKPINVHNMSTILT